MVTIDSSADCRHPPYRVTSRPVSDWFPWYRDGLCQMPCCSRPRSLLHPFVVFTSVDATDVDSDKFTAVGDAKTEFNRPANRNDTKTLLLLLWLVLVNTRTEWKRFPICFQSLFKVSSVWFDNNRDFYFLFWELFFGTTHGKYHWPTTTEKHTLVACVWWMTPERLFDFSNQRIGNRATKKK